MSNKLIVSKSNHLIEASYRLTRLEQYFILYLISKLDSIKQKEFTEYTMSESEILDVVNYGDTRRVAKTDDIFTMMRNLNRVPIAWENEEERGEVTWISSLVHKKNLGIFTFSFDPNLSEFLLELKSYFTKYALENIQKLTSKHSIRIYELLAKNKNIGSFTMTLDRLRFILGVEDKYQEYYELRRRILDVTKKELAEHTDISFNFVPCKREKKKVISLKFIIFHTAKKTGGVGGYTPATTLSKKEKYEEITKRVNGILYSNPELERAITQDIPPGTQRQSKINLKVMKLFPDRFKDLT